MSGSARICIHLALRHAYLAAYLKKKDARHLVAELAECKTCGGAVAEVYVRVCRPAEVARLQESGCRTLEAQDAVLFLNGRGIKADAVVELGLRNFLGIKDVTAKGLHL